MTLTRAVAALPSTMTAIRRPDNGGGARRAAERGAHGPGIHDALGVAAGAGQGRVVLRGRRAASTPRAVEGEKGRVARAAAAQPLRVRGHARARARQGKLHKRTD